MTGYKSKRAAAQDKLDDDDALTIAYQSGYYDGKKAAQPAQEPLAVVSVNQSGAIRIEYTDGSAFDVSKHVGQRLYTYPPPQPAKELVAWMYNDDNELIPLYTAPPQEQQSCDKRPWVGLTDEEIDTTWKKWIGTERANKSYTLAIENALRIKNT